MRYKKVKALLCTKIQNPDKIWSNGDSFIAGGNVKWGSNFEKSLVNSNKTKHTLVIHAAVMPLGLYPNELKPYVRIKSCTGMYIGILFMIDKIGSNQDVL